MRTPFMPEHHASEFPIPGLSGAEERNDDGDHDRHPHTRNVEKAIDEPAAHIRHAEEIHEREGCQSDHDECGHPTISKPETSSGTGFEVVVYRIKCVGINDVVILSYVEHGGINH